MFGKDGLIEFDEGGMKHKVPVWFVDFIRDYHGKVKESMDKKTENIKALVGRIDKAADLFAGLTKRVDELALSMDATEGDLNLRIDRLRDALDGSRKAVEIAFKAERGIRVIQDQILVSLLNALGYKAVYDEKKKEFVVIRHSAKTTSNRVDVGWKPVKGKK